MRGAHWRQGACRSPYGERGLKYKDKQTNQYVDGRSPYGERGLK